MPQVAQATIAVTPTLKGAQQSLTSQLTGASGPAGKAAGTSLGKELGSFAVKTIAALGIGKAVSDSISDGMNFETSMAKAATLFTGTSQEFAALQDQILGISNATGVAASELAEAAYSAESASVPMGNLGTMLDSSAKLATAGFTDIDTALSATAKTMNAYGMMTDDVAETQANMEKVQKVLIQTQNKGITTVGELGASLAQVTPTAAAAGVSFDQVGAALALMTAQGTPTAQATTQLRSAIAELEKSGTKAATALDAAAEGTEYAGMSFTEMMASGADLGDVMGMLQAYADASGVSMLDLWSSIEGGNAAMAIAKDVNAFNEDLAAMSTEADVVGDAYGTMADTVQFKAEQIKTSLENMGISAFAAVADDLSGVLDGVSFVLGEITPALGDLGGAFMDVAGAAVDTVADWMGLDDGMSTAQQTAEILKSGLEGLTSALQFVADNMGTIAPIALTLGGALLLLKSPIPGIVSSLGGMVGKIGTIGGEASSAAGPIASAGGSFGTMAGGALKLIAGAAALWITAQAISTLADSAIEIASAGGPAIGVLLGMAIGIAALMAVAAALGGALTAGALGIGIFGAAMLGIGGGIDLACDGISRVLDAVSSLTETISTNADGINEVVSNMGETAGSVFDAMAEGIATVVDSMGGAVSGVLDSVAGVVESMGDAALNAGSGFETLANAVINLVNNTGVLDLGATLATVASGVSDISKNASDAGDSAGKVNTLTTSLNTLKASTDSAKSAMDSWGSASKSSINGVAATFSNMNLAGRMQSAISGAISAASAGINTLHAMFSSTHFSFQQHIAVPHFHMYGSFSAKTVPSIGVSWYARAAEYGALFTKPTVIGVGDAAQPELLLGENKLKELLSNDRSVVFNVTVNGAEDPEAWAAKLINEARQYMRAFA